MRQTIESATWGSCVHCGTEIPLGCAEEVVDRRPGCVPVLAEQAKCPVCGALNEQQVPSLN